MASFFPSRRPGLAHWADPAPGLMMRAHVLPNGAELAFALNWTGWPQLLEIGAAIEFHDIVGSCALAAHSRWKMPPFSGALLTAS
jgi:hypothetical protein